MDGGTPVPRAVLAVPAKTPKHKPYTPSGAAKMVGQMIGVIGVTPNTARRRRALLRSIELFRQRIVSKLTPTVNACGCAPAKDIDAGLLAGRFAGFCGPVILN